MKFAGRFLITTGIWIGSTMIIALMAIQPPEHITQEQYVANIVSVAPVTLAITLTVVMVISGFWLVERGD